MLKFFKSSMLWQMVGGFVLGTAGIVSTQSAEATSMLAQHIATIAPFIG